MTSRDRLRAIFPRSEIFDPPDEIRQELGADEHVLWVGGPSRWGLFRATPFALILIGALGYLRYLADASDTSAEQYLLWMLDSASATDAWILPGLVLGYLVILAVALRDPRKRWLYAATDRRLMTFYKGRKLREATAAELDRLQSLKGLEGRLRDVGDVVWARVHRDHGPGGRGPDQGRHGFRGVGQPDHWRARMLEWAAALAAIAAEDAGKFVKRAEGNDAGESLGTGLRRIENRKYGFAITLPEHWLGRIGQQQRAPFRLLGLTMPFQQIKTVRDEPIHRAPDEWNYITVRGRAGLKFNINVNDGPPVASFETSRDKVGKKLTGADANYRCGMLSGYRIDYLYLDKNHVRFVMLAGDGFHILATVSVPPEQAPGLLPAIDAALGSIAPV